MLKRKPFDGVSDREDSVNFLAQVTFAMGDKGLELAHWLRTLAALAEDPNLFPSTHVCLVVQTACNSSFREPVASSGQHIPTNRHLHMYTHICTCTHAHKHIHIYSLRTRVRPFEVDVNEGEEERRWV